jgi:hypothetical protein
MVSHHANHFSQLSFAFVLAEPPMSTPTPSDAAPADPFAGREYNEVLQVTMTDGRILVGKYWTMAGMHLLTVPAPGSILGESAERMPPEEVVSIVVLKDKSRVKEELYERTYGDRVPGREPVTRDDFRYRLEILARAVVQSDEFWRRHQLENQFHAYADLIELAKSKRAWILRSAKWYLTHNAPPEMADIWQADVASPSLLQKPRDQDFDPDPTVRAKRVSNPAQVAADPLSVPNVLNKLKALGCAAYISLAGEVAYDKARICINFHQVPGRAKVYLSAKREGGKTTWDLGFDCGNSTKTFQRIERIKRLPLYALMLDLVKAGLSRDVGGRW